MNSLLAHELEWCDKWRSDQKEHGEWRISEGNLGSSQRFIVDITLWDGALTHVKNLPVPKQCHFSLCSSRDTESIYFRFPNFEYPHVSPTPILAIISLYQNSETFLKVLEPKEVSLYCWSWFKCFLPRFSYIIMLERIKRKITPLLLNPVYRKEKDKVGNKLRQIAISGWETAMGKDQGLWVYWWWRGVVCTAVYPTPQSTALKTADPNSTKVKPSLSRNRLER